MRKEYKRQDMITERKGRTSFFNITDTNIDYLIDSECISSGRIYLLAKRIQDIVLSAVALIILFPLLIIVSIIIFVDDPKGSPIFTQERSGKNGKIFKFYKFRTMCVDAEDKLNNLLHMNEMKGPAFKIKNDPRITRVGKFLRKTNIDELPQLINVLKGDMSIVGPRPPLPREVKMYDSYQMQRLCVTPGLSCLWQIQDNRNDISFDDWVKLDIQYIVKRNFLLDWKIIVKTILNFFKFTGI